jgi:hypothetical protein
MHDKAQPVKLSLEAHAAAAAACCPAQEPSRAKEAGHEPGGAMYPVGAFIA